MRYPLIATVALLLMLPASVSAEDAERPPRGLGYFCFGAGTRGTTPTAGFGGEVYVAKGLGLGAEVGSTTLIGDDNKATGVGSADLSYHFFPKNTRGNAAPFVEGGYTLFFGHNTGNYTGSGKPLTTHGFNVGGGVDVFASKHVGVRFDVRYHGHGGRILRYPYPDLDQFSFVAFRVGVTFR